MGSRDAASSASIGTLLLTILLSTAGTIAVIAILGFFMFTLFTRHLLDHKRQQLKVDVTKDKPKEYAPLIIGFFHPNCSAGGGGERVLWTIIQCLNQIQTEQIVRSIGGILIYTTDPDKQNYDATVLGHVYTRFGIDLRSKQSIPLTFLHLKPNASSQPTSLISQSWKTMLLAYDAISAIPPDVYFDTTGCAFTYLLPKLLLPNCKVGCYVHYPTISTDMLKMVYDRRPSYNHSATVVGSPWKTAMKLVYYTGFAVVYGFVGSLSDLVLVNSTWTFGHVSFLWRFRRLFGLLSFSKKTSGIRIVYPPCDTEELEEIPLHGARQNVILSIGQFRPEKNHELQIRSFSNLLKNQAVTDNPNINTAKLVLLGSTRNTDDWIRVGHLRALCQTLEISDRVEFVLNQPFPILKEWLAKSSVGLHTMWNEHFGIGIVEMMSAGLVTIAHDSGGPKSDIVSPNETGYLAATEGEYERVMVRALAEGVDSERNRGIREAGRIAARKFSVDEFHRAFKSSWLESTLC